jgi:hypothetical protein
LVKHFRSYGKFCSLLFPFKVSAGSTHRLCLLTFFSKAKGQEKKETYSGKIPKNF